MRKRGREWLAVSFLVMQGLSAPWRTISAQTVSEFAIGVARIRGTSPAADARPNTGAGVDAAIRAVVAPRVRLGLDVLGVPFYRHESDGPPCALCIPRANRVGGIAGAAASGQIDLDAKGRFFLSGGVGAYALWQEANEGRVGLSAGAGVSWPLRKKIVVVAEASWLTFVKQSAARGNVLPLTIGLRF